MKSNQVPGLDGFTAEFYKMFWPKLKFFITRAIDKNELSQNLRRDIVTCNLESYLKTGDPYQCFELYIN